VDSLTPDPAHAQIIIAEQSAGDQLTLGLLILLGLLALIALAIWVSLRSTLSGMLLLARTTRQLGRSVITMIKWLIVIVVLILLLGKALIDSAGHDDGAPRPSVVPGAGARTTAPPPPSPLQRLQPTRPHR
jgi:hypothetical protein